MVEDTQEVDNIKTFLDENQDLIAESEAEKKARIAKVETRLIEHLRNEKLRLFLLNYKKLTGRNADIVLTPSNEDKQAHVLVLNQDGLFIVGLGISGAMGTPTPLLICKLDESLAASGSYTKVKVLPRSVDSPLSADGELSITDAKKLVNEEFLSNLRGGGTLFEAMDTEFVNEKQTPRYTWNEEKHEFDLTTHTSIDVSLMLGLDKFAKEMRGNSQSATSTPLTNPSS